MEAGRVSEVAGRISELRELNGSLKELFWPQMEQGLLQMELDGP